MSGNREKHQRASRRGLIAAVVGAFVLLVASSSALAAQDQLKGGSVVIQLQGSHGLKLKPTGLNLPITGGAVDPIDPGMGVGRPDKDRRCQPSRYKGQNQQCFHGATSSSRTHFASGQTGSP